MSGRAPPSSRDSRGGRGDYPSSSSSSRRPENSGGFGGGGGERPNGGVCFAFQKGSCDRGSSCRFTHDGATGGVAGGGSREQGLGLNSGGGRTLGVGGGGSGPAGGSGRGGGPYDQSGGFVSGGRGHQGGFQAGGRGYFAAAGRGGLGAGRGGVAAIDSYAALRLQSAVQQQAYGGFNDQQGVFSAAASYSNAAYGQQQAQPLAAAAGGGGAKQDYSKGSFYGAPNPALPLFHPDTRHPSRLHPGNAVSSYHPLPPTSSSSSSSYVR